MIPLKAQGNLFIILFNGYGDAFLALPVLRQIIQQFRRHKIYLACFDFQINTLFHDLEVDFVAGESIEKKILPSKELKKLRFEQLVSFNAYYPDSFESEIRKIYPDVTRWGFCDFNGTPFPKFQTSSRHMREQYFEVIGWKPLYSQAQRQVRILPQAQRKFNDFFQDTLSSKPLFYTLHLDSLREKMWNLKNWFSIIEYLWSKWNARPLILGEETPEAEELTMKFSFARKLPSSMGIDAHFAAIENTEFFIGIDSIFAHIADSFQKLMIVLFGPSDNLVWGPTNPNSIIVKPRIGNSTNNISPEEVIILLDQVFNRRANNAN